MSAVSSPTQFPLTTLRISPTGDNNLNCFYDKPLGRARFYTSEPDKLVAADYSKVVRAAAEAGIDRILIGGAEPLVRKDIGSVIKAICSCKKVSETRLITNGIFLKDYADAIKRAGLKHLEVNLDSLNFMVYQKITRRDGLYRALDGLQKVERLRFDSIVLNIMLIRGVNDRELIDFAIMSKEKPYRLNFLEYVPLKGESTLTSQLHYPVLEAKKRIRGFQALLPIDRDGVESFQFENALGCMSFQSVSDSHLSVEQPMLVLNSQAELYSTVGSKKVVNLRKEMEKDSPEDKLVKVFQKLAAPSKTKSSATKTKTTPARKTSSRQTTKRARSAEA